LPAIEEVDEYEDLGTYSQLIGLAAPQKTTPPTQDNGDEFGVANKLTS
jgi:hypothetical protein